jgi:glutamine synthetase
MSLQDAYVEELKKDFELNSIKHIKIAITDINGVLRSKYMAVSKFLSAIEHGFGFCDVILGSDIDDQLVDDLRLTGWHSGYPDATAIIDLKSARKIPHESFTRLFLADFEQSHLCPRQVLKSVIKHAHNMNYYPIAGMEFEFSLFDETPESAASKNYQQLKSLTQGNHGYSFLKTSVLSEFHQEILQTCDAMNIDIEGLHTEIGPGVLEAAIAKAPLLETADNAILFKNIVKTIALRHGFMACFMAKWSNQHQGQSGHIHLSLVDNNQQNCFYDDSKENSLSDTMCYFLGGQQHLMPEFLLLNTPYVNSYNRLTPGFWAPTQASWGIDNRTCALRVINPNPKATRIEYRIPGADCNPYLAMSAALASGLWGITNQRKPSIAIKGNAYEQPMSNEYQLPNSIEQAGIRFKHSTIAKELFGEKFVSDFTKTRLWEGTCYQRAITDWQLHRYFELA